jgi:hypothetical protein
VRDLEAVRRVGVGAVQDARAGLRRDRLDQRRDVHGSGRVVRSLPAVREEHGGTPVEHALDEDPLTRRRGSLAVDLRRTQHGHGMSAVEQDAFRSDLVRAVAVTRPVVAAAGRERRLSFGDRTVERRRLVRVRMPAGVVDIDRLARDHHGRSDAIEERQEQARVRRGVGDAVHEQVGSVAEGGA